MHTVSVGCGCWDSGRTLGVERSGRAPGVLTVGKEEERPESIFPILQDGLGLPQKKTATDREIS